MKKILLLIFLFVAGIGFSQQTTVKENGKSNPIYYNQKQRVHPVVTPSASESEVKNLGENRPNLYNPQNPGQLKNAKSPALSVPKSEDGNKPVFYKKQANRPAISDFSYTGASATDIGTKNVVSLESSLFGTHGFSSSGLQGKTIENKSAGSASQQLMGLKPEAPVVITHSLSQNIVAGNSVTCNAAGIPKENSYFRDFNLATDFGITDTFNVTNAEFAVEAVTGPTNLTLNVYSTTTTFPGGYPGSLTLQGTASYVSNVADANKVISVPLTATIPAGAIMVYELKINAGATFSWFPGSNAAGQTGKSWIMSADCSISVPTDLAGMGFPGQHMVMNIVGEEGTGGGGGTFPDPYCPVTYGTVEPITLVEVAGISNRSSEVINGSPAHEDFTAIEGSMEEGQSYTIALEGNTAGGFTCSFTVFIDWNQDGILDNASERYEIGTINNSTGIDGKQATNTITVPAGVTAGPTRMRVMKRFGSTYSVDSCTGTSWGQAEDYTINVTSGGGTGTICANPLLEVNQDVDDTCMANISQGGLAQSYTAQESESAGAGIKFRDPSTGLNVTLSLWDGLPNAGGTMLATGTSQTDGTNWADVYWDPVVNVTVGNTYYIVIDGDSSLPCVAGSTNNPYAGGMTYANNYGPFPNFDYTFRTYSCDSGGGTGTACSQDNPTNSFENGFTTSKNQSQIIATDITVPADVDFRLEKITVNIWMNPGSTLTSADITFYDDASNLPGAVRNSQPAVVPVSQTVIGNNFGFDISEVVFDITPEMLPGQPGASNSYWVSLYVAISSGSGYIDSTSASIQGASQAFSADAGATWNPNPGWDSVYVFEGTCIDLGGGDPGDPCAQSAPSNSFENGKSFTKNLGRIVAADISLDPDVDMMLETINFNAFIGGVGAGINADNVDVFIYADSGTGSPGALLDSQIGLIPTSQTVIGNNFGFDIWSIDLDITDYNLLGQAGAPTTYWIGLSLEPTDGSNTFWEYQSTNVVGNGLAYNDGSGFVIEPTNEVVYTFAGTCTGTIVIPGDDCGITGPSNGFEDGKSFTKNLGRIVANDIPVPADMDMVLEKITISAFIGGAGSGVNASNVDVFIYENNSGKPGALVTSQTSLVPDSQTVIGSNFGYDLWEVVLDIDDVTLTGTFGAQTTYWIGLSLEPTDGSNTFWEFSSAGVIGYGLSYNDGSGFVTEPSNEGVYVFEATCSPMDTTPLNDECSGAFAISCGESVTGTTVDATIDSGAPTCGPSITSPGVWYTLDDTSGMAGEITFSLCDGSTNFDTKLSIYTGTCSALVCVAGNDDFCGLQSEVTVSSDGNTKFYILVHSFGGATGTFTLEATCSPTPPPNDKIANSIYVTPLGFPYTDPAVAMPAATPEAGNPQGCDLTGANGVWYHFTSSGDGIAEATIVTPGGASSVTFYSAPSLNAVETDLVLVPQNSNQCVPGTSASIYTLAGEIYYVFVLNSGAVTDIVIDGTNLGVSNNTLEGFTYYPNPTNGLLNLSSKDNIQMVTIYNLLGQTVLTNNVGATSATLNISGLSVGTYMMKATVNGQVGVYKIVKK